MYSRTSQVVLSEYASILLRSAITAIFFFQGSFCPQIFSNESFLSTTGLLRGIKTAAFATLFVWVRATLPRLRYDVLRTVAWTEFLPVIIAILFIVPCILGAMDFYF